MRDALLTIGPIFGLILLTYWLIWHFVIRRLLQIGGAAIRVGVESLDRHDQRNVAAGRYEPAQQNSQAGTDFIMQAEPLYSCAPDAYSDAIQPANGVQRPMYVPSSRR